MPVNAFKKTVYTNDSTVAYFNEAKLDDGSWTLVDTTSLIDTAVWDAVNGNTITLNAFGVANDQNQIIGSGGTTTAPHWKKLAYYDDGTPVLNTDAFILWVSADLKGSTAGTLRYFNWGLGTSADTTSTLVATIRYNGVGAGWNFANTDADTFGKLYSGTASPATGALATDTHILGNVFLNGGNYCASVISTDISDIYVSSAAQVTSTTTVSGGQQLQIRFVCGPNGTTRTFNAGDQTQVRLFYKFQKVNKLSAGF